MNNTSVDLVLNDSQASEKILWPSVLLFIFMLLPEILPAGIETFLFMVLLLFVGIWWVASHEKFPSGIPHFIGPLIAIVFVGLLGAEGHQGYDVAKDVWHVTNPALALLVGYVLMLNMKDLRKLFKIVVVVGTFIAFLHVLPFALHLKILELDATDIRKLAGAGFFEPALALGVMLTAKMMGIKLFERNPWFAYIGLILCMLSVVVSFSRTIQATLVLIVFAVAGWLSFTNRLKVILMVFVVVAFVALGIYLTNSWEPGVHVSLFDKFLFSFQEMRVVNYTSLREINEHWRGYETARALYTYSFGTPWQYLVGGGFGTNVDLGLFMKLGEEWYRYAPILHDGYMYLLVKTGIVGLFLYLLLLYRVIRKGTHLSQSKMLEMRYCGRLIVGLGLSFIVSTFVITGMFNKTPMVSTTMLLGALLAYGSISGADNVNK